MRAAKAVAQGENWVGIMFGGRCDGPRRRPSCPIPLLRFGTHRSAGPSFICARARVALERALDLALHATKLARDGLDLVLDLHVGVLAMRHIQCTRATIASPEQREQRRALPRRRHE